MRISIASASPVTNDRPLPDAIIEKLKERYSYVPDINFRLYSLPEVKRGLNKGEMAEEKPHENAVEYAERNKLALYVGYLIEPDRDAGGLQLTCHSFCVDEKRREVVEPTAGIKWSPAVRYIGRRVHPRDIPSFKYLHDFNRTIV